MRAIALAARATRRSAADAGLPPPLVAGLLQPLPRRQCCQLVPRRLSSESSLPKYGLARQHHGPLTGMGVPPASVAGELPGYCRCNHASLGTQLPPCSPGLPAGCEVNVTSLRNICIFPQRLSLFADKRPPLFFPTLGLHSNISKLRVLNKRAAAFR